MAFTTSDEKVYGKLITTVGQFEMLAPEPEFRNLPVYLRDGAFSFYVIVDGFARHIIVKDNFVLVPYNVLHTEKVNFELYDEEVDN